MKPRNYIFLLCFVILICGIAVLNHLTADRVEDVPTGYLGNTAGNLNNGGYFCESDGKVYFSNFYDGGTLYCMNADESDIRKLSKQAVQFLNIIGSHLYYYQCDNLNGSDLGSVIESTGLYRCTTDGKNVKCLKRGAVNTPLVNGNQIYYLYYDKAQGYALYRMSTSGKNETQITDYIANPACGYQNYIYFNGTEGDHNLYQLNVNTDQITRIWDGSMWNPVYSGGYIYYMDLSADYRICRLNMNSGETQVVTTKRVDFFNVSDDYVFFQTAGSEEPGLYRINKDGSNEILLAGGVHSNLCLTSEYLYFTPYGANTMYHCALDSTVPQEFRAALEATVN